MRIRRANTTTNQRELIPDSIEDASAIPARSAAMLIVFAIKRATTTASSNHLGNRCLRFPARPRPVTLPMRAHIICTAAISGHVSSAVHNSLVPSWAPATRYVAMPDGSSSAAPVMIPGPSAFSSARIQRDGAEVTTRSGFEIPSDRAVIQFSLMARGAGRTKGQHLKPAIDPRSCGLHLDAAIGIARPCLFNLRLRATPIKEFCLVAPWLPGWLPALYPGLSRECFLPSPSPAGRFPSLGAAYPRLFCPLFV